ncbi:MAG: hypothetical protein U9N86_07905, partial [Bacteroidota bacterium]|nr:hypothetical protein [Bacteroidota bacterium]
MADMNTIVAIATASGMGAIALIRVSGSEAIGLVDKVFFKAQGSGLKAQGSGLKAQGSGLKAQGSGLKAQGSGLKAQGSGL